MRFAFSSVLITGARAARRPVLWAGLALLAPLAQAQALVAPAPAATRPAATIAAPAAARPAAAPATAPAPAPAAPARPVPASKAGAPLFVLNSLDGNVSVIDPATWTETRRIPTGREPHHLYLTPDEKSVIVANAGSDSLTFINPRTAEVQRTLTGIRDPYHLRFSPDMKWFVTAANRLNHVDIYRWDGANLQLAKRISTGRTPSHLWIDTKSTTVYASMQDSNELVVIDLATQNLTHRVKVGPMPADVFVTPDDKTLLIGMTGSDVVEVYDVSGVAAGQPPVLKSKIVTGKGAHAFRAAGDRKHVYVSNRVANTITKINYDTLQAVQTFAAPAGPDCMDISSDGKTIMVGSRWARKLTVIDAATGRITRQVDVGKSPHGVWTLDHVGRQ